MHIPKRKGIKTMRTAEIRRMVTIKTYENKNFKVEFKDENHFLLTNLFGDEYGGYINENGKTVAFTAKGLGYAEAARRELNF